MYTFLGIHVCTYTLYTSKQKQTRKGVSKKFKSLRATFEQVLLKLYLNKFPEASDFTYMYYQKTANMQTFQTKFMPSQS